jgi:hypothetical protein
LKQELKVVVGTVDLADAYVEYKAVVGFCELPFHF